MKKYLIKMRSFFPGREDEIELHVQLNLEEIKNDCLKKFGDTFRKFVLDDEDDKLFLRILGFESFYNDNKHRAVGYYPLSEWDLYLKAGFKRKKKKSDEDIETTGGIDILKSEGNDSGADTRLSYYCFKNDPKAILPEDAYENLDIKDIEKNYVQKVEKYLRGIVLPKLIEQHEVISRDLEIARIYLK